MIFMTFLGVRARREEDALERDRRDLGRGERVRLVRRRQRRVGGGADRARRAVARVGGAALRHQRGARALHHRRRPGAGGGLRGPEAEAQRRAALRGAVLAPARALPAVLHARPPAHALAPARAPPPAAPPQWHRLLTLV